MIETLRRIVELVAAGDRLSACQVVATTGSTPAKAGARLVVEPGTGSSVGGVGGGPAEAEARRRAEGIEGRAEVYRVELDDETRADGQACGGAMTIVVESVSGAESLAYYRAMLAGIEAGEGVVEAVAIGGGLVGGRALFDDRGAIVATVGPIAAVPGPPSRTRPGEVDGIAYIPARPAIELVVVGEGPVGREVAGLASRADFEVVALPDDADLAGRVVSPRTYAVIATRGQGHDRDALASLAGSAAGYVGMIGSRRKVAAIFDALREQGVPEAALARVSAPIGLAIGSETPFEIALSIVAELISRRNLGPVRD